MRPGGVVAFVTSRYTMDSKDSTVRRYLAQRAELLGAIRLPNNAFKANAGTEVVSDIIFLQKRDRPIDIAPDWTQTGQTEDDFTINRYFLDHPEMVLGKMSFWKNMYGNETETACLPIEGADLTQQLAEAVQHITPPDRELLEVTPPEQENGKEIESIPADPTVRNFSFALSHGNLYFRENSRMNRVELGKVPTERVKGMIGIRDSARKLIDLQLHGYVYQANHPAPPARHQRGHGGGGLGCLYCRESLCGPGLHGLSHGRRGQDTADRGGFEGRHFQGPQHRPL